jgi:glutamate racemase
VSLVEEGWVEGEIPRLAVREYLAPLVEQNVNAVLLGCTHYPLLRGIVESELTAMSGTPVAVVDSAHAIADEVKALIESKQLGTEREYTGTVRVIVTDKADDFETMAARFLGRPLGPIPVTAVDI